MWEQVPWSHRRFWDSPESMEGGADGVCIRAGVLLDRVRRNGAYLPRSGRLWHRLPEVMSVARTPTQSSLPTTTTCVAGHPSLYIYRPNSSITTVKGSYGAWICGLLVSHILTRMSRVFRHCFVGSAKSTLKLVCSCCFSETLLDTDCSSKFFLL